MRIVARLAPLAAIVLLLGTGVVSAGTVAPNDPLDVPSPLRPALSAAPAPLFYYENFAIQGFRFAPNCHASNAFAVGASIRTALSADDDDAGCNEAQMMVDADGAGRDDASDMEGIYADHFVDPFTLEIHRTDE